MSDCFTLQQDKWSLTEPVFGIEGQLTVKGYIKAKTGIKLYVTECKICSNDVELFKDCIFRSTKGALMNGSIPCGCAKSPHWTVEQYRLLCSRKAGEDGYRFLDFEGKWRGQRTNIRMFCNEHGEWATGNITKLLHSNRGCPRCVCRPIKEDHDMIPSFFDSGAFHPDTKFWRSERLNTYGQRRYWFLFCPVCEEVGESFSGSLQSGFRPCGCSHMGQKECYINLILDNEAIVGVKFGIANDSHRRIKNQNRLSCYSVVNEKVYSFPDSLSCKRAERDCKKELECGIILKRDMPDGYTETTWPYNLEKIIEIYERNGGILNEPLP